MLGFGRKNYRNNNDSIFFIMNSISPNSISPNGHFVAINIFIKKIHRAMKIKIKLIIEIFFSRILLLQHSSN
jgi:hypothetical protein